MLPNDEDLRLLDLKSYEVLGNQAEADFNDLAELTSRFFNCPVALVTLIGNTQQWFKGKTGTNLKGNDRNLSFCTHTILKNEVMVVEDATKDERFFNNPTVTAKELNLRFYAGAPIVSPAGFKLGTICMFDTIPKSFSEAEKNTLNLLAKQAGRLLELRKKNLLIREHAEEIILEKTKLINNVVKIHEDDNRLMAYNLHEKLAQEIAATLLYLKAAETNDDKRTALVNTAKVQLEQVLEHIKKLSNDIIPTTANFLPVQNLVAEYAKKIAPAFAFAVSIVVQGNNDRANAELVIISMRIVEEWFQALAKYSSVTRVELILKMKDRFELIIEDNMPDVDILDRKKAVSGYHFYERVMLQSGLIELSTITNGKNILTVSLPV